MAYLVEISEARIILINVCGNIKQDYLKRCILQSLKSQVSVYISLFSANISPILYLQYVAVYKTKIVYIIYIDVAGKTVCIWHWITTTITWRQKYLYLYYIYKKMEIHEADRLFLIRLNRLFLPEFYINNV